MKIVILAGGLGTRLSEETVTRPKPMVEIGAYPILWHIMKGYLAHGFDDFVICLGYKGYFIKEYFANYRLHNSDVRIDFRDGAAVEVLDARPDPWRVTLIDTGENTQTGGRLKRVARYLDGQSFMLTYGDGVSDVDIKALLAFHKTQGKKATITAVRPMGRFGSLSIDPRGKVRSFVEKPAGDGGWINGGFFVMEPGMLDYIEGDATILEREPLERAAAEGELAAYQHAGFWSAMDTLRDKEHLQKLWASGSAPWKIWP